MKLKAWQALGSGICLSSFGGLFALWATHPGLWHVIVMAFLCLGLALFIPFIGHRHEDIPEEEVDIIRGERDKLLLVLQEMRRDLSNQVKRAKQVEAELQE